MKQKNSIFASDKSTKIIMRKFFTFAIFMLLPITLLAQNADEVLKTAKKVNDYFMHKYADPTTPTFVRKVRPSSLWTRGVYYEGMKSVLKSRIRLECTM